MSDPVVAIKAGEPERLSEHEQRGTWRIPLNIEPNVEWRRRFLRTAHADGLFADRKIAVQCAALVVELDGTPLSLIRPKIAHWIAQANNEPADRPSLSSQPGVATILALMMSLTSARWRRTCWSPQGTP